MPVREGCVAEDGFFPPDIDTGYHVVIRKGVTIGTGVCVWSNTVIDPDCRIGNRVRIHANCYLAQQTVIEDDAFIGPGTVVLNDRYPVRRDPAAWEPVTVKQGARVGGGVTILPGVTIGEGALVGGGAVVTKDVPAGEIWAGNPARRLHGTRCF